MSRYAIGLLLLAVGVLAGAYWTGAHFDRADAVDTAAVDPAAIDATENDAETAASDIPAETPAREGSANRRMDDFGSGPSGTTITVPLRDRHRQAFAGGGASGGGAPAVGSEQDGDGEVDAAALPAQSGADDADEAGEDERPSYRVIERAPDDDPAADTNEASDKAVVSPDDQTSPSFDVVRVGPTGQTVLAGRAEPLTEVEIKVGDEVIDRVTATASGEWVSTPIDPLSTGDQELSLSAVDGDNARVDSRQIVVVSVPEAEPAEQGEQAVAVILDKDRGGEGRILQAPDKLQSEDDGGRLALKLVDYDDDGAVKLSGEAPAGVPVRIYIDNEPVALVIGDSDGAWITTLDRDLPGGDYTLRLDQLDLKGQTVARLETPFTRVTAPPVEGETKVDYVVVQPGNSLWRIARRLSGDGFNYVYIFEANQAQIRDPDVIYPGQVFEVPVDVDIEVAG